MKAVIAIAIAIAASLSAQADGALPSDAQTDAAFENAGPDGNGTASRAEAMKFGTPKKAFDHANPDPGRDAGPRRVPGSVDREGQVT